MRQKRASHILELDLQVVSYLTWVLGNKLESSVRTNVLIAAELSLQP